MSQDEFVDYSTILIRIQTAEKALHDACLNKQFERVPELVYHLIEQAVILKRWAAQQ